MQLADPVGRNPEPGLANKKSCLSHVSLTALRSLPDMAGYQSVGTPAAEQPGKKGARLYVLGAAGLVLTAGLITVGFSGSSSHKQTATTTINMAPSSTTAPDIAIADDLTLLKTPAVAATAVLQGRLNTTPKALLSSYKATATGDSIIQITASASTKGQAIGDANAVASAFLAVQTNVESPSLQLR